MGPFTQTTRSTSDAIFFEAAARSLKAGEASKAVDTYDMAYAACAAAADTKMDDLAMLLTKRGGGIPCVTHPEHSLKRSKKMMALWEGFGNCQSLG